MSFLHFAYADGADQMGSVITLGRALGAGTLAVTAVVKFLCLSFSIGFGFVGMILICSVLA